MARLVAFYAAASLMRRHLQLAEMCLSMAEHWRARAKHHVRLATQWTDAAEKAGAKIRRVESLDS